MTVHDRGSHRASDSCPTLAIASNNAGKLAEFRLLLGDRAQVVSLSDLGLASPEETGATFEENAELKARYVFEKTGLVTLADDSGLEVDALGGLPGVRSARYAGDHHNDADNRALILRNLAGIVDPSRTARLVSVIAVVDAAGATSLIRETCEGTITDTERGANGFGYDPIFELPDRRTMAELARAEKNLVSNRGRAVRKGMADLLRALDAGTRVSP